MKGNEMGSNEKIRVYHGMLDGYEVWIGRDARSNDYVTTRLTRPNDFWFHIKGTSGAHVVLCCHESKQTPNQDTIEKVASLTAYYSKQKKGGVVPVVYALGVHVHKPAGAPAGLVHLTKEKRVKVVPRAPEDVGFVMQTPAQPQENETE